MLEWTQATARQWLDGQGLMSTGNVWATAVKRSRSVWLPPRELPARFANATSRQHRCLEDAVALAGKTGGYLSVVIGYAFRRGVERGIVHCACVDPDMKVVDPCVRRLGLPRGYLMARPSLWQLSVLASCNGIELPASLRPDTVIGTRADIRRPSIRRARGGFRPMSPILSGSH